MTDIDKIEAEKVFNEIATPVAEFYLDRINAFMKDGEGVSVFDIIVSSEMMYGSAIYNGLLPFIKNTEFTPVQLRNSLDRSLQRIQKMTMLLMKQANEIYHGLDEGNEKNEENVHSPEDDITVCEHSGIAFNKAGEIVHE